MDKFILFTLLTYVSPEGQYGATVIPDYQLRSYEECQSRIDSTGDVMRRVYLDNSDGKKLKYLAVDFDCQMVLDSQVQQFLMTSVRP